MSAPSSKLLHGDCSVLLGSFDESYFDSCVTDAPYEIKILGNAWDATGIAFDVDVWKQVFRVLKPGAFLLNFTAARTYHRIACAIEDAGFQIVDQIAWIYGSGMPAGGRIGPKIDKKMGAERKVVGSRVLTGNAAMSTKEKGGTYSVGADSRGRSKRVDVTAAATPQAKQWEGWGCRLKPALEPIVVARKPFKGPLTSNVMANGTGAFNVDGCAVEAENGAKRWPPNVALGHSPDCSESNCNPSCPVRILAEQSGNRPSAGNKKATTGAGAFHGTSARRQWSVEEVSKGDTGTAARYFPRFLYHAKASTSEKTAGGKVKSHPTTKPQDLVRYLVELVTAQGCVLDPFVGSGTTAIAAESLGIECLGIDSSELSINLARERVRLAREACR